MIFLLALFQNTLSLFSGFLVDSLWLKKGFEMHPLHQFKKKKIKLTV